MSGQRSGPLSSATVLVLATCLGMSNSATCSLAVFHGNDSSRVFLATHPGLDSWTLRHQLCRLCHTHPCQPAAALLDPQPALQGADSDTLAARPWHAGLPACTSGSPHGALQ